MFGEVEATVDKEGKSCKLPFVVEEGDGPLLFGRIWLKKVNPPWSTLFHISGFVKSEKLAKKLEGTLSENASLFDGQSGLLRGSEAHLDIESEAKPVFCKARPVPIAIKKKIEVELDRLEKQSIIQKVTLNSWAALLVSVVKPSGKLGLCGDFKVTVNRGAVLDCYPLSLVDELFANLAGGEKF